MHSHTTGQPAAAKEAVRFARCARSDLALHLACQQLVEFVREDRIDDAVAYGQKVSSCAVQNSQPQGNVARDYLMVLLD